MAISRYHSFAAGSLVAAITALPMAVHAQAPAGASDIASTTAKTVQVTITRWSTRPAPVGQVAPLEKIDSIHVALDRTSDKVRLEEFDITPFQGKTHAPSLVVSDGKTQYDLIGTRNQYLKGDATSLKDGLKSRAGLTDLGLASAMGWKSGGLEKYVPVADAPLNGTGTPLKVYLRTETINGKDKEYTYQFKLWVDPTTHFPVQQSLYVQEKGSTEAARELQRTEFKDWKVDAPLEPSLFVWAPPAGATEYKEPERPKLLAVGAPAPDFIVSRWGGGDLKLSDYRGKVAVLDFWATWCGPCQASMPHVEQVYQKTKDKNVAVVGVCVWDTKEAYDKWVPEHKDKYSFTFGFDPAGRGENSIARKLFNVSGIPTTYVIDKDGKVAAAIVGYEAGDARLEETLTKLGIDTGTPASAAAPAAKTGK